jgi:hypothetical protein
MLYTIGGPVSYDEHGFRALGHAYMVMTAFAEQPFADVTLAHAAGYVDGEWERWCEQTLTALLPDETDPNARLEQLLQVLEGAPGCPYTFDRHAFHGVLTARQLRARYESWRPRVGDEAAERRTHFCVIRVQPELRRATPTPPPAGFADAGAVPLAEEGGGEGMEPHAVAADAVDAADVPVVQLELDDFIEGIARDIEHGRFAPDEAATAALDAEEQQQSEAATAAAASGAMRDHHFALVWRYGEHTVVGNTKKRENLSSFHQAPSAVRELYERARSQQASMWRTGESHMPSKLDPEAEQEGEEEEGEEELSGDEFGGAM